MGEYINGIIRINNIKFLRQLNSGGPLFDTWWAVAARWNGNMRKMTKFQLIKMRLTKTGNMRVNPIQTNAYDKWRLLKPLLFLES